MNPLSGTFAAVSLACLAAAQVAAQPGTPPPDAEPVPRYRVEFVIFAHRDVDAAEEQFPTAKIEPARPASPAVQRWPFGIAPAASGEFGEPVFGDAVPAGGAPVPPSAGADTGSADADAADARPPATGQDAQLEQIGPERFRGVTSPAAWFERLDADAHVLTAARARLERLDAYEVLAHAAWEQDAQSEQDARSLTLAELGIANPSGSLRLHVSRFLHLTVDLGWRSETVRPAADDMAPAPGTTTPFGPAVPEPALLPLRLPPVYTLEAQRRARSDEVHYIDHPLFGVLFTVTRAPEPEEAPEPTPDGLTPAA